jgi:hypothetical protein
LLALDNEVGQQLEVASTGGAGTRHQRNRARSIGLAFQSRFSVSPLLTTPERQSTPAPDPDFAA